MEGSAARGFSRVECLDGPTAGGRRIPVGHRSPCGRGTVKQVVGPWMSPIPDQPTYRSGDIVDVYSVRRKLTVKWKQTLGIRCHLQQRPREPLSGSVDVSH